MSSLQRQLTLIITGATALAGMLAVARSAFPQEPAPLHRIYAAVRLQKTDNDMAGGETNVRAIVAIDPATGKWSRLTEGFRARVSPDGQTLVFQRDEDLWSCDTRQAANPGIVARNIGGRIGWLPDNQEIVASQGRYIEKQGWQTRTERIRLDGTVRQALPVPSTDFVEDLSPDGQWLLTSSDRHPPHGSGYQLYRMRLDGSQQQRLTKGGLNVYARFSRDGRRIAYIRQTAKEGNSLHVMDLQDLSDATLTSETNGMNSVRGACWSPDGQRLCVLRFDWTIEDGRRIVDNPADANYRFELMDADGSNSRPLQLEGAAINYADHPDWR